ncbi:hypothetical protein A2164_01845 [Candidatus Curtissbacteria bacterium RBG_13_35_7]|uniref:Uncharacterized protein n=1 Tax=Candidatus Curtissbacteria bacterium RBG_13_35_7 TaxID=1797705 RepID=A0A1F5G512_9BACT|nr:MAG: hypothetical protein A2164_01845 [Candidatus Curtissbacteria bacterium RBG_13_35_7]
MKHYIKSFILTIATVYIVYNLVPTISFGQDPKNIVYFIGGLWLISQIINPIFSIVLLPINLLTFGLVSFILNTVFVYVLTNYLPNFTISAYDFPGAEIDGIIFPPISFTSVMTIILVSLIITLLQKLFHLIFE